MTTPDFSQVIPLKWKPYVGLVGSILTFTVPYVLEVSDSLPSPWPVVIAGVLALLTALGIYKAPYVPKDAVVVPVAETPPPVTDISDKPRPTPGLGGYTNPWT